MHKIRIPQQHWGRVWKALLTIGPVTRISLDYVYLVSDRQLQFLRRKRLPFELVGTLNGAVLDKQDG